MAEIRKIEPIAIEAPPTIERPTDQLRTPRAVTPVQAPVIDPIDPIHVMPQRQGFQQVSVEQPPMVQPITPAATMPPKPSTTGIQTLQGPGEAKAPDFTSASELAKQQAEQQKATASTEIQGLQKQTQTDNDAIQKKLQEGTVKLEEKAKKETEESLARSKAINDKLNLKYLEDRSTESKNIANGFSHLFAQGKDSGFINAANMSAMRDANRRYGDAKLQLDLQFMQESNNAYNKQFDTVMNLQKGMLDKSISIDEATASRMGALGESLMNYKLAVDSGANQVELNNLQNSIKIQFDAQNQLDSEWNSNIKSQIEGLISQGMIEEASALANEAAKVSDNGFFSYIQNPDVVKGLMKNNDAQSAIAWNTLTPQLDQIALNALGMDGVKQEEAARLMFDMMKLDPERSKLFVDAHFKNIDESEYAELGIDGVDAEIMKEYISGARTMDDPMVQQIFAGSYAKDLAIQNKRKDTESMLAEANIPSFIQDSIVGNEIVQEWITEGMTSDFINIDVSQDNIFGRAGINRIEFYGRQIDPTNTAELSNLPGLDVAFEGFGDNPDTFQGDYTPSIARSKNIDINGVGYKQGELIDSYLQYVKEFQKNWSQQSTEGRAALGEPFGKDEFERRLKNAVSEKINDKTTENNYVDLNEFRKSLMGTATTVTSDQYVKNGKTIKLEEAVGALDEDNKKILVDVLEGKTNINDLSQREFYNLVGKNPAIVDQLEKSDIMKADAVIDSQLHRGKVINQKGHTFSSENLNNVLSDLKYNNGVYEGNILYGTPSAPYRIQVSPDTAHYSSSSDTWDAVAKITLIPVGDANDGAQIELQTRLPDWKGDNSRFSTKSSGTNADRAMNWSRDYFKQFEPAETNSDILPSTFIKPRGIGY